MLMEKVLEAAAPYLEGKTVDELVVGLSLTGCLLSDGNVGVSYIMRDELPSGCSVFPFGQEVEGRPAKEIAQWVITGKDDAQRAIGAAVLDAASQCLDLPDDEKSGAPFGLDVRPTDKVAMIGLVPPIAAQLRELAGEVVVFDHGLYLEGEPGVLPTDSQAEVLPTCDIVIMSGTTTINGTCEKILEMSPNVREAALFGTSTPMFPKGFEGTGVTKLAGAWWKNDHKDQIFKLISLAAGISSMKPHMIMKRAEVNG